MGHPSTGVQDPTPVVPPAKAGARNRRLTVCRGAAKRSPSQDCVLAVHATAALVGCSEGNGAHGPGFGAARRAGEAARRVPGGRPCYSPGAWHRAQRPTAAHRRSRPAAASACAEDVRRAAARHGVSFYGHQHQHSVRRADARHGVCGHCQLSRQLFASGNYLFGVLDGTVRSERDRTVVARIARAITC